MQYGGSLVSKPGAKATKKAKKKKKKLEQFFMISPLPT